ncbi:MAG: hypothetical protein SV775_19875 [Thermodesulfobacteriota bacterium]|nr:hypothetical protein [Thermodesulfobacteriota bacterium]
MVDSRVYVPGDNESATTYMYDIATDTWSAIPLSGGIRPAQNYGCVAVNNEIWRIGGVIGGATTNEVWVLNTESEVWSLRSLLEEPRMSFAAGCVGDTVGVAGGVAHPGFVPVVTTETKR